MTSRSVHDNEITAYTVDGEARRITLHTRYTDGDQTEYTDVVFDGVLAYFLRRDNFVNIIFGIEEIALAELLEDEKALFKDGEAFCWPGEWNTSLAASLKHCQAEGAKAFELSSSMGMGGWVIATSCLLEPGAIH